jgi:hypothetical protein
VQVKFVRSGGIAGLEMVATVDSDDLSADHQDLVASLVAADLKAPDAPQQRGADQFSYQLEIDNGDRTVRRHWDGPEVPETVRPLLTALTRQARPAR